MPDAIGRSVRTLSTVAIRTDTTSSSSSSLLFVIIYPYHCVLWCITTCASDTILPYVAGDTNITPRNVPFILNEGRHVRGIPSFSEANKASNVCFWSRNSHNQRKWKSIASHKIVPRAISIWHWGMWGKIIDDLHFKKRRRKTWETHPIYTIPRFLKWTGPLTC